MLHELAYLDSDFNSEEKEVVKWFIQKQTVLVKNTFNASYLDIALLECSPNFNFLAMEQLKYETDAIII